MNGPHDVGGKHGMGSVDPEAGEPNFHDPWEGRMYGVAFASIASGCLTIDEKRHAIEKMPHAMYLDSTYYEHWLYAIERVLDEKGIVATEEVDRRVTEQPDAKMERHPELPKNPGPLASKMLQVLHHGTPHDLAINTPPCFQVGQAVQVRNLNSRQHLRLPSYAKKRIGVVDAHYGGFAHPRAKAHGEGEVPTHLYRVRFSGEELWGPDAESRRDVVYLDLCEDYLEAP